MPALGPDLQAALWLSTELAVLLVPAYVLGAAWLGWLLVFKLRRNAWLDALVTVPVVFPPVVIGFALLWLLGRETPIGQALHALHVSPVFHFSGLWLAAFVAGLPLAVKPLQTALQIQPRSLHETALTLGCKPRCAYWRVHLPLALPALLAGLLLALARGMGEVGISLMLGGNILGRTETLSLAVFNAVTTSETAQAALGSALLGGFSLLLFAAIRILQTRELRHHDVLQPR